MFESIIALLMLAAVIGGLLILVLGAASIQKTMHRQDKEIAQRQADLELWYQLKKRGESFDAFRERMKI